MSKRKKCDVKQYDKISHKVRNYISKQETLKNNNQKIDTYNNNIGNIATDNNQTINFNLLVQQFSNIILKINCNTQKDIKELLNTITNNIVLKYDLNKLEQDLKQYPKDVTNPLYESIVNCNLIDTNKSKKNKQYNLKNNNYISDEDEDED